VRFLETFIYLPYLEINQGVAIKMDLTLLIGIIVTVFFVLVVVAIYFVVKKLFGIKSSKEISIYVDERKENASSSKITNTPFLVDRKGKLKLSSN